MTTGTQRTSRNRSGMAKSRSAVPLLYAIFVVDLHIVRWPGAAVAAAPAPGALALSEVA